MGAPDLPPSGDQPSLPAARGPLSAFLLGYLPGPVRPLPQWPMPEVGAADPLADDDLQLALYVCYELHYRGFRRVDDGWEWEPTLLAFRRELETAVEYALVARLSWPPAGGVPDRLAELIGKATGPSLSAFMAEAGRREHMAEFAVHRSAYQLKEADPHTWVIPRLAPGGPKSALIEIQADEYGGGSPGATHAELFADAMAGLGLDPTYGTYLDLLPGTTLATVNLVSLFGLHRRWRGALIGHLAVFEMTSAVPMGRYSRALARMGAPDAVRRFYDVHVEADAHHAVVAAERMAGALAAREPALATDILFGATALMEVEGRFARHLLDSWSVGRTSLLHPLDGRAVPPGTLLAAGDDPAVRVGAPR